MSQSKEIITYMDKLGSEAKEASVILSQATLEQKNEALARISEEIQLNRKAILEVNQADLAHAKEKSIGSALILSLIHI